MAGEFVLVSDKKRRGLWLQLLACVLPALAASCVPAGLQVALVPGFRGPEVTIPLDVMRPGELAPRLTTTPLTPVDPGEFDPSALPALDAVTNPDILAPVDPALANLPPGVPTPMPVPQPLPAPNFAQSAFDAGPAVSAYAFRGRSMTDAMRAQLCLTTAIYYEAASESDDGQRAVAQVVLNRVRHPAYPNTVCDVVYQGTERGDRLCQFSFACDGSMGRTPARDAWARASRNARLALAGYVFTPVGAATHYHTLRVNPVWNRSLTPTAVIGAHIFWRWGGAAGRPGAFYAAYTGREPTPAPRPHPIRPVLPAYPAYPAYVPMATASNPMPQANVSQFAPPPPDASLAGIRAREDQTLLARQRDITAQAGAQRGLPQRRVNEDNRYVSGSLPESDVRPEYRGSGDWIAR